MLRWLSLLWAKLTQPGTGGLIQTGDFRVRYPDGQVTHWMSYGDACVYQSCFGGKVEWKGDF